MTVFSRLRALPLALLVAVPLAAQDPPLCLLPEKRAAQLKNRPGTHPDFKRGLEALEPMREQEMIQRARPGEEGQWQRVAACMCLAVEHWPEDENNTVARFYDRWFPRYLPRYYLGLAFYKLGCDATALLQFGESEAAAGSAERKALSKLLVRIQPHVDRGEWTAQGADCSFWQAADPEIDPPPTPTRDELRSLCYATPRKRTETPSHR